MGADITSSDFNQFLKLLKMSGVLGGNSVSDAFAGGIGPKGFRQGIRKGGGRRKRPKKLRQRPVRPIRPQYDYYDYDYAEYDALEAQHRPPPHASSPAKRPFNQRLRTSGSDREPDFPPLQVSFHFLSVNYFSSISQTSCHQFVNCTTFSCHNLHRTCINYIVLCILII